MQNILIIGATSAIAEATARLFASRGNRLFLVARNAEKLDIVAADLRVRGAAEVFTAALDATDFNAHRDLFDTVERALGDIDIALIAHGTLSNQAHCEQSIDAMRHELDINAVSTLAMLTDLANRMEVRHRGTIAVISSVAGDRGRQSNYVYGAAKAAVTAFLSGLRQRLATSGVNVLTIKPGFVDTPMTASIANKGALWARPERVAADIVKAIDAHRKVIYVPWFWRWILLVIRSVPETIFSKLKL